VEEITPNYIYPLCDIGSMAKGTRGWPREPRRHSLAARGIASSEHDSRLDFPLGRGKDTSIAIYVPGTQGDRVISAAEHESRAREVRAELSKLFGGYTSIDVATGGWVDRSGRLVEEPVIVVRAYTDWGQYTRVDADLEDFVRDKLEEWNQDAISVEFEEELYFVE